MICMSSSAVPQDDIVFEGEAIQQTIATVAEASGSSRVPRSVTRLVAQQNREPLDGGRNDHLTAPQSRGPGGTIPRDGAYPESIAWVTRTRIGEAPVAVWPCGDTIRQSMAGNDSRVK